MNVSRPHSLSLAMALLACAASRRPAADVAVSSSPAVPASSCAVAAEHAAVSQVEVSVGGANVSLRLDDANVSVEFVPGHELAQLMVRSPLSFRAPYPVEEIELRTSRDIELAGGLVVVRAGAKPTLVGVHGNTMVVALERALGVVFEPPLALSCSDLTIAAHGARYASPARRRPAHVRWASFGDRPIPLHLAPTSSDARAVRYVGPFEVLASNAGWLRIRADWEDGSHLAGWTPAQPLDGELAWPDVVVDGASTGGGCHSVDDPRPIGVRIRGGAGIASAPNGTVWARFPAPTWVEAQSHAVDGWIAITRVPGVALEGCAPLMWVLTAEADLRSEH